MKKKLTSVLLFLAMSVGVCLFLIYLDTFFVYKRNQ